MLDGKGSEPPRYLSRGNAGLLPGWELFVRRGILLRAPAANPVGDDGYRHGAVRVNDLAAFLEKERYPEELRAAFVASVRAQLRG